jgi:hypothetical protein
MGRPFRKAQYWLDGKFGPGTGRGRWRYDLIAHITKFASATCFGPLCRAAATFVDIGVRQDIMGTFGFYAGRQEGRFQFGIRTAHQIASFVFDVRIGWAVGRSQMRTRANQWFRC